MKTKFTFILVLVLLTIIPELIFADQLSKAEKEGIQLMREEEKLAQDVYLFLYDQWGLPIFSNISYSETRHFNAVGYLLENFKISDPALPEMEKFQNKEIAFLYDSLTQKGSESLVEALKVGAFIEEFDIADLQKLLASNTDTIIEGNYQNLLRGSNNHLRAFTGQLESRGEIYNPVILDKTAFLEVAQGSHQMGGGNNSYVLQQNNCQNQQNNMPVRNRIRGKGRMRGQRGWN
ncbi:MAG: DUF2202 domain-containing protein [Mariniphaga sp.]|nr:DUF2202 domain-containing protein [Mariniphaga sp.]